MQTCKHREFCSTSFSGLSFLLIDQRLPRRQSGRDTAHQAVNGTRTFSEELHQCISSRPKSMRQTLPWDKSRPVITQQFSATALVLHARHLHYRTVSHRHITSAAAIQQSFPRLKFPKIIRLHPTRFTINSFPHALILQQNTTRCTEAQGCALANM